MKNTKDIVRSKTHESESWVFYCMQRRHFEHKDTIVTLICDPRFYGDGEKSLVRSRTVVEEHIQRDPVFGRTHDPHRPLPGSDPLVLRMAEEASRTGVGPMAAVAGAFAEACLLDMLRAGAPEAIVDNGGDIAFFIRKPVRVGIYAGASPIRNLAFELEPRPEPFGVCTSSGTVGPSFSYGKADAAVVVSGNTVLADAAATALGNRVKTADDLESCFDYMEGMEEIEGALVIFGDRMAMWGSLPRLVKTKVDPALITQGKNTWNAGQSATDYRE
jgi:ApbE superfamily uncharacterized protein (UPF0280 family)